MEHMPELNSGWLRGEITFSRLLLTSIQFLVNAIWNIIRAKNRLSNNCFLLRQKKGSVREKGVGSEKKGSVRAYVQNRSFRFSFPKLTQPLWECSTCLK